MALQFKSNVVSIPPTRWRTEEYATNYDDDRRADKIIYIPQHLMIHGISLNYSFTSFISWSGCIYPHPSVVFIIHEVIQSIH